MNTVEGLMTADEAREIAESSDVALTNYILKYLSSRIYEEARKGKFLLNEEYCADLPFWQKYTKVVSSVGTSHIHNALVKLGYKSMLARDSIRIRWY